LAVPVGQVEHRPVWRLSCWPGGQVQGTVVAAGSATEVGALGLQTCTLPSASVMNW
jgi:hypothetical protein